LCRKEEGETGVNGEKRGIEGATDRWKERRKSVERKEGEKGIKGGKRRRDK
jgi:hypothetical protein